MSTQESQPGPSGIGSSVSLPPVVLDDASGSGESEFGRENMEQRTACYDVEKGEILMYFSRPGEGDAFQALISSCGSMFILHVVFHFYVISHYM
jgi:hypothetical protein